MGVQADELIRRKLDGGKGWPLESERPVLEDLKYRIALRENDREYLAQKAGWTDAAERRTYRVDPLAPKMSDAYSALLFSKEPPVRTADEGDQERMDEILRLNRWRSSLQREERTVSSEGEVWYRLHSDPATFEAPMIEWYSRSAVVPLFRANVVIACAFIDELDMLDGDAAVYRHFEVHDREDVANVLYAGTDTDIGAQVALDRHPDTAGLDELWGHGLGMLAGRILNQEGSDPDLGVSDYEGIEDWFLELNECLTTGAKNRKLTALTKVYAPDEALDAYGNLPEHAQVLRSSAMDKTLGDEGTSGAFGVLQVSFDAQALIEWTQHVATTALGRKGITAQFVGMPSGPEGYAATGTALRLRMIPSVNEGERKGSLWIDETDGVLLKLQLLDSLGQDEHGFGVAWNKPEDPPTVEIKPQLPRDEGEEAMRVATLKNSAVVSTEQAVRELHPDWTDDDVDEEVQRIKDEQPSGASAGGGGILRAARPAGDSGDQGPDREAPDQEGAVPVAEAA